MERRRPSLIGPLILITLGILLLLANLGMLPFSFWEIAIRFWPLLLILIGLEIIVGRHSVIGSIIVLLLWLALVVGVLWLALTFTQGASFLTTGATTSEQFAEPLGDIKGATVELNIGVSTAYVTALGSDTANLAEGTFRYGQGARVVKTYNVVGSEWRLALREEGNPAAWFAVGSSRWDIALYPQVPLALRVNGGAGRLSLDLAALNVSSLNIDAGVGSLTVTTPKAGMMTMRVNGGVGSAAITIPQGVAARIRVQSGLGNIRVDDARFPKFGDTYQSADYASASNKIDVEVNGGVGSVGIR